MIAELDIRSILKVLPSLAAVADTVAADANLFDKGLDSFGSVQLMLALEDKYEVEFPDHLLNRKSFATITAIRQTVGSLLVSAAA